METLFKAILILHIIAGTIGLLSGSINLVRKKGDKKHKFIGRIFSYAMMTTGFSALGMTLIHPQLFLFIVGVFTIYLVGTGNRYIYLKLLGKSQKPGFIDWLLTLSMLMIGLVFVGFGTFVLMQGENMGVVLIVFGIIGLLGVMDDFRNYRGKAKTKNYWLLAHIARMTAGYIAASTAFLVVNMKHFPDSIPAVFVWLFPTVLLTPLIFRWSLQYKVR